MTASTLLIGLVCLIAGAVIGALLSRGFSPQEQKARELEEKLAKTEDEYKTYQHEVTEHFIRTSELVGNLTRSYRDVHQHLASSAMHLANPDISRQLLQAGADEAGAGNARIKGTTLPETPADPPRDYAPTPPGGILDENYGLESNRPVKTPLSDPTEAVDSENAGERDPTLKVG